MQLPNVEKALVSRRKTADYLLAPRKVNDKSGFFLRLGFRRSRPQELERALLKHAKDNLVASATTNDFGHKYIVEGAIETPGGRNPMIRAVWQVNHGTDAPHLVTAYRSRGR